MTSSVTSVPISIPSGIRASKGVITLDTAYGTGVVLTAAQFGGGTNGLPNRLPDAVIPAGNGGGTDFTTATPWAFDPSTGKIHLYGEAYTADADAGGETEFANETISAVLIGYVAFWFTPDPVGLSTVVA